MKLTQEQVIEKIKDNQSLQDFPEWKDNKEVVLKAVKGDDSLFKYASERLRDDKEVALEAVKYGWNLEYASERLRDDKIVVLEAIKQNGMVLKYASERLRDNKKIVLEAVRQDGFNLEYASDRIKKELLSQVLVSLGYSGDLNPINIVSYDGYLLSLLTIEQQNNKEVVLEAVRHGDVYLVYASQEIKEKIGDNDPVQFLEQWVKIEKQKEHLNQQLVKKENKRKVKI